MGTDADGAGAGLNLGFGASTGSAYDTSSLAGAEYVSCAAYDLLAGLGVGSA